MNELTIFEQREVLGVDFKIYGSCEEPLFLAKDVASWIEHSDPSKMVLVVDEDEKLLRTLFVSGQNRDVLFLTEDGLYEVLMQSRKPIAKEFKKKVKEILKDIRKHGAYLTDNMIEQVLTNPDTIIRLATQLKEERVKTKLLETTIEEQKPLVEFSETILKSKDNISMDNMAKLLKDEGLDIGRNRLFEFLRQQKVLNSNNIPYQNYMNKDWFTLTEKTNNTAYGVKIFTVVLVTPKGQVGIATLVRNKY